MGLVQLLGAAAIAAVVGLWVHVLRRVEVARAAMWTRTRRPSTWLVGVPVLAVVLLVGGPFIYIQAIRTTPPKPLSFADLAMSNTTTTTPTSATTSPAAVAGGTSTTATSLAPRGFARTDATPTAVASSAVTGSWVVGRGSQARYHIDDTAMGMKSEVVGSTSDVSGTMKIVDSTVAAVRVVVNMQTVRCDCVHDSKYRDMLDVDQFPTSTFELTRPIALSAIPSEGQVINVPVTGNFTIHGVTRPVSFTLAALRQAGRVAINGKIPVRLEDYNIENPNAGAFGGLSNCYIEVLVAFDRAR